MGIRLFTPLAKRKGSKNHVVVVVLLLLVVVVVVVVVVLGTSRHWTRLSKAQREDYMSC